MSLEIGTYISDLDSANPTATDLKSQGDDHFRLIKRVVKATFPNINAEVRTTPTQLNQIADNTYTSSACSGNSATATHATSATTLTGGWTSLPAGTRMPFAQAAAPTGWVQDVSDAANNRMLRVVSTAGGGIAGTHSPILNNVVPTHTHGFSNTTAAQNADHTHSGTTGTESADHTHYTSGTTSTAGEHNHTHQAAYHTSILYGSAGGYGNYGGGTPDDGASLLYTSSNGNHTHTWAGTSGGRSAAHTHNVTTGGMSASHAHAFSGTTDGGSSATNWAPRYIDLIVCAKA